MYKFWRILTFNLWQELNLFSFSSMIIYQLSNWSICKEIQPVHPKGGQSWVFIGRSDVEAETPVFWPPDAKSWLTGKDPDAGKDWGQKKWATEDEMVGWHQWQWKWVWGNSRRWWRTGSPGVLQSVGSQRVRHDLLSQQQQQCLGYCK